MELIQTVTVGSGGASSISFTGIPADSTDLLLVTSLRSTVNNVTGILTFNSGGTYTRRRLFWNGSTGSSPLSDTPVFDYQVAPSTAVASAFSNNEIYIANYALAVGKTYSTHSATGNNVADGFMSLIAGFWNQTAAITSITLTPGSGNFVQHSSASLYKITKA